ncbi:unnamed protein product, partial [Adineta steineri]
ISYNQPKLCANASWNSTAITFATSATVGTSPVGIFVSSNNTVYATDHLVAGTGTAGATSLTLNSPRGIFIDNNLNLYVADGGNNRIQKFLSGQLNGTTIPTGTIVLSWPTAVVLDADGYLFIVDYATSRIIGSGPYGFRCIAACSGQGSQSNQLYNPEMLSFDSYGNIFVTDYNNNRIQKFLLITSSCSK